MKYFAIFFFTLFASIGFAQDTQQQPTVPQRVSGYVINDDSKQPLAGVNIINTNKVRGAKSDEKGYFEIDVQVNDTLHFSILGFQSLRIRVTNDWIKNKVTRIQLTEKAIALEEVVIAPFSLTGYLEIDSKLIPTKENYRYSISGLTQGYEAGEYAPNAFGKVLGSIFNPADMLYNFFGKNGKELKKLKEMKKDDTVRTLLESKYDRETVAVLLGVSKDEIPEIMHRCNYSDSFIQTANDLQIMDAISACYEQYKVLKRN
ncbi:MULTISPECIES: carboxypeptidase-like regulatory domain-containing protein [Flavobacterium]|jgi:hypothetical protein|uniref:CarboxypepD_reg-like domain-containing protein n=1 Tax=Flavobacterium anhuiense TaxID=459526 RepID=A0AAC9CWM8_9FLAO|nr:MULTISPECIES: carboxypeptidase-like regulatory domain-containing protein [Flavobacterium]AOC93391.1 hypothetical protein BB050_00235 [Flavobacterium anhuiense]EJG02915.1 hypothetical protein FF52_01945 [Flavobacterium sp. F52]MXO05542.1 carboxypeptidase-like regulatory domain-containing protein [Flavobacterium sp. HBTb2-11-1]URM39091.1 carboxypeptidase-like regulatory domain-containing protein [Flavobacterium anhuiense]SCY21840.1 CarboxypepD_reg-like domain-containing protein [Flavobacteriu